MLFKWTARAENSHISPLAFGSLDVFYLAIEGLSYSSVSQVVTQALGNTHASAI
jgi:hypothetical protein